MIASNKNQTNHKKINSRTQFDAKNFITKIFYKKNATTYCR